MATAFAKREIKDSPEIRALDFDFVELFDILLR